MRRRPRPHHTRKMKRRELLEALHERRPIMPWNDAPYIQPERLEVETIKGEFFMHFSQDPDTARRQAMAKIGQELDEQGFVETLATRESPNGRGKDIAVRIRVIRPQQR